MTFSLLRAGKVMYPVEKKGMGHFINAELCMGVKMKKTVLGKLVILTLIMSMIIIPFGSSSALGQYNVSQNTLRVALGLDQPSGEFTVLEGEYELIDYQTQRIISPSVTGMVGSWLCAPAGGAGLQISNSSAGIQELGGTTILLRQKNINGQNIFRYKNKRYRGDLLLQNVNGRLQVINIIDIEQYLYGVVGDEIGYTAPLEALKAQAVVSRTYALYYKQNPQLHYDLGITTSWQIYGGYDSELQAGGQVKTAVDTTRGQVITYQGKPIQAFFHANAGGYTEACENVWWDCLPYIQPVPSPQDSYALQHSQSNGWPASTYQWERTFTLAELNNRIAKWNNANPSDAIRIGSLQRLQVSRFAVNPVTKEFMKTETASRRVTQLDFIGTSGVKSFTKNKARSVLDLPSTLFEIFNDSVVAIWNAFGNLDFHNDASQIIAVARGGYKTKLNGENGHYYVIGADGLKQVPKKSDTITIKGRGSGHGLGMSQWGARGMASQGSNYQQIILYYYNQGKNDGTIQITTYQ